MGFGPRWLQAYSFPENRWLLFLTLWTIMSKYSVCESDVGCRTHEEHTLGLSRMQISTLKHCVLSVFSESTRLCALFLIHSSQRSQMKSLGEKVARENFYGRTNSSCGGCGEIFFFFSIFCKAIASI